MLDELTSAAKNLITPLIDKVTKKDQNNDPNRNVELKNVLTQSQQKKPPAFLQQIMKKSQEIIADFGADKDIIVKCTLEEMIKRFFNDYEIVWFDSEVKSNENRKYIAQLEKFYEVKTFTEWKEASTYIIEGKTACHVITSGKNGESLTKEIFSSSNVVEIYIFCQNKAHHEAWAKDFNKISCIETEIQKVLDQIQLNLKKWYKQFSSMKLNLPAFAPIFNDSDKSEMNNLHRYLRIIPNFQNTPQATVDLVSLAKQIYSDENNMKFIKDFETTYKKYDKKEILTWYTQESFVYKITNNLLRIASADSIQYGRLLIRDIERALREQYLEKSRHYHGLLFRGTYMMAEEWANLKENLGREIEMHGFLSASKDSNVSIGFIRPKDIDKQVFITILMPRGLNDEDQGFGEIEEFSRYPSEREILFNVRSRFTVLETEEQYAPQLPVRHLVLLYGAQGFRKFTAMQSPVQDVTIQDTRYVFCNFCSNAVQQCSPGGVFFASFRNANNRIFVCQTCLPEFVRCYNAPLVCIPTNGSSGFSYSAKVKGCNLAYPPRQQVQIPLYGYTCAKCQQKRHAYYFKCTECTQSLGKKETWCPNCFESVAGCMLSGHAVVLESFPFTVWCEKMSENEANHLRILDETTQNDDVFKQAEMYYKNNQFEKAIMYYKAIIQQNEKKKNDSFALSCLKLGHIYHESKQDGEALIYFIQAANFRKKFFGYNRPETALCYDSIGTILTSMKQFERASEYLNRALRISKVFSGNNEQAGTCYCHLGDLSLAQEKGLKAIEYYTKALGIYEGVFGKMHPEVALMHNKLGVTYQNLKMNQKAEESFVTSLEIRKVADGDKNTGAKNVYNQLGNLAYQQGEYENALGSYTKGLEIAQAVYGNNHVETATCVSNVAMAYEKMKDYVKALENHVKTAEINKAIGGGAYQRGEGVIYSSKEKTESLGENHEEVAVYHMKIGNLLKEQGEYNKALEYHMKALEIRKGLHGESHVEVANAHRYLAGVHEELEEYQKAIDCHTLCEPIWRKVHGENHVEITISYDEIGRMYDYLKDHQKSFEYYSKSFDMRKTIYGGENHLEIAVSYDNMGGVYYQQKDYQKALEFYTKSLELRKSSKEENKEKITISYKNMGRVLNDQGEYEKALDCYFKALEIRKVISGAAHAETADYHNLIADIYKTQGSREKALEHYSKCLEIRKDVYGNNHVETASSHGDVGSILRLLGQYKKALIHSSQALEIKKVIYGKNHSETAICWQNAAQVLASMKEYKKAREYYTRALEITELIYGENYAETANLCYKVGDLYDFYKEYAKAIDYYSKCLKIRKAIYGENHADTANAYIYVGHIHTDKRECKKALEYFSKALEIRTVISGYYHAETAFCYNWMANVYYYQKDYRSSFDCHARCLDIRIKIYGSNPREEFVTCYYNFGRISQDLKDYHKALENYNKALEINKYLFGDDHSMSIAIREELNAINKAKS